MFLLTKTIITFSLFGYGLAVTFKQLSDEDIKTVEHSVRTLSNRITGIENSENFTLMHFGKFFSSSPDQFEFSPGDKQLLKKLVEHVNYIIVDKGYDYFNESSNRTKEENPETNVENHQTFLNKLIATAKRNSGRSQQGYRYSDDIQQYATYLRMIMGNLSYQSLQANLRGALPSIKSVNRYIHQSHEYISEGVLRHNELYSYLTERKLPLIVSISEDATRVVGRPQYCRKSNKIIGFTLPINQSTGLPIPSSFPANNFGQICKHFIQHNSISAYVNIVVAQPLCNAPPFCLLIYGSDNKFSSLEVLNRWRTITTQLKEVGIDVLTISTDSDPRYNSAMRIQSKLGIPSEIPKAEWFCYGKYSSSPICMQDLIHIATKLRSLLLRTLWNHLKLPFGNYFIDANHLIVLMNKFPKDKHELTHTVLRPVDKQNFQSVLKICSEKVTALLKTQVKGSEGTVKFLELLRMIIESHLDPNLTPLERVHKLWYATFFLRIWRQFIKSKRNLSLDENFMTLNSYVCVELNAHGLIHIIHRLKEMNAPHLFLLYLYASQPCESTFRQSRSFTSTYSTVVNCTVKEFLERATKIHLQCNITHLLSGVYEFPRLGQSKSFPPICSELPSMNEIFEEITKCKKMAIEDAKQIGLIPNSISTLRHKLPCDIKELKLNQKMSNSEKSSTQFTSMNFPKLRNTSLKNYSYKFGNRPVDETGPYVEVYNSRSKRIIVKKTSLCWMLSKDSPKLSSDRLLRVKTLPAFVEAEKQNKKKPKAKKKTKRLLRNNKKAAKLLRNN